MPNVSDSTGAAAGEVSAASEVVYENTADEVWGRRALDLYQRGELQVQSFDTEGVVSAQAWGHCPRCGHDLNVQETLSLPLTGLRGRRWNALTGRAARGVPGIPATVEVGCGCERAHPGAPTQAGGHDPVRGCGVSFRLPTIPPDPSPEPSSSVPPGPT